MSVSEELINLKEMARNVTEYKLTKENFIADHNGTTIAEVSVHVMVSVLSVFFRDSFLHIIDEQRISFWLKILVDFTSLVVTLLCCHTVLHSYVWLFLGFLLCASFSCIFIQIPNGFLKLRKKTSKDVYLGDMTNKMTFIDNFRAYVNISTAVAILAVDFIILPRRFAKTETYGTGLMDVGVGCFIMANAVVSPEARRKHKSCSNFSERMNNIAKIVTNCIPLLLLGLVRVIAVKGTNYQEHVSEYGVHWNFFLTLAIVKILSSTLLNFFPVNMTCMLGGLIAIFYQYLLSYCGLSKYILYGADGSGNRNGFFDSNREGIFSSIGFVALYLIGVQVGLYLFKKRVTILEWLKVFTGLVGICIACLVFLSYLSTTIEPVSRRLCNLTYIIWMIAVNLQMISGYLLVEIVKKIVYHHTSLKVRSKDKDSSCCLLAAVNYNALGYFMLANLLTGLVNMSIHTVYTSSIVAFIIMFSYLFLLSFISMLLYKNKISVKFW